MKKTYINPEIKVIVLSTTCHMLAGSDMNMRGDYDSKNVTIGSRGGGLWDDDEEEY